MEGRTRPPEATHRRIDCFQRRERYSSCFVSDVFPVKKHVDSDIDSHVDSGIDSGVDSHVDSVDVEVDGVDGASMARN